LKGIRLVVPNKTQDGSFRAFETALTED